MIFAHGRHMQVLLETPASVARREQKPRARPKYQLGCTCSGKRRPNGHCVHTLAIFEDRIQRHRWRDVAPYEMRAKEGPVGGPIRPRVELERELEELRAELERRSSTPGGCA